MQPHWHLGRVGSLSRFVWFCFGLGCNRLSLHPGQGENHLEFVIMTRRLGLSLWSLPFITPGGLLREES